jgi:hypothetical protein
MTGRVRTRRSESIFARPVRTLATTSGPLDCGAGRIQGQEVALPAQGFNRQQSCYQHQLLSSTKTKNLKCRMLGLLGAYTLSICCRFSLGKGHVDKGSRTSCPCCGCLACRPRNNGVPYLLVTPRSALVSCDSDGEVLILHPMLSRPSSTSSLVVRPQPALQVGGHGRCPFGYGGFQFAPPFLSAPLPTALLSFPIHSSYLVLCLPAYQLRAGILMAVSSTTSPCLSCITISRSSTL